jgi:glycosidase
MSSGAVPFVLATLLVGVAPVALLACSNDDSVSGYSPPPLPSLDGSAGDGSTQTGDATTSNQNGPDANGVTGDGSSSGSDGTTPSDGGSAGDGSPNTNDGAATPATCPYTFTLADNSYSAVVLNTDFSGWDSPVSLTKSGSTWSVTTPVPYGIDVEYKFVADGNWITDPAAPTIDLPSQSAMTVNNILQAVTCGVPSAGELALVGGAVSTTATSYSFQVHFAPGGADLDPTRTVITLNGSAVAAGSIPYDATSHTFTVSVSSGVTPNKYGYLFQVADKNGLPARLFVPFWIESTTFEWNDAFLYEVMIDRFLAGGTSKQGPNGPPTDPVGDWKGGDFGGVTQQINAGYFQQMGVNALWLSSPVLGTDLCEMGAPPNAGHCLSGYHSYFPIASGWTYGSESDPMFADAGITQAIDPHFGTAADLVALVNAAHAHGMRVLTDLVVNHVFADANPPSGQAPQLGPLWATHQATEAWFNTPYNNTYNDCGDQNLWDTSTTQTWNRADCWFDPYLPDFNTTDPTVDDAVANHAVWLMEQFNLDGFRVDAVKQVMNNICIDLRSKINAAISTNLPFYMVGEALGNITANVMDCVGDTKLNGSVDDPLHNNLVNNVLQEDDNAGIDLDNSLIADESTWTSVVPDALMGHFFGSHDTPRAISLAEGDSNGDPWSGAPPAQETNPIAFEKLELAQAVLLTYDPIPILWMGDEFGQPGTVDPDSRRMMRFGSALSSLEQGTLTNLQKLGKARLAHSSLRRGSRTRLWVDAAFYAYARVDPLDGDIVVAAFNFSGASATRTMTVSNVGLVGAVTDALSGTTATVADGSLTITLPALTAAVFTQQ